MILTRLLSVFKSKLNSGSSLCLFLFCTTCFFTCIVCREENLDKSGLCLNSGNASCANQVGLFNLNDDSCRMFHRKGDSVGCSKKYFTGDVDADNSFSRLSLLSYLYREGGIFVIPTFNLTFSNIRWISMKMRFSEDEVSGVTNCREFKISPNINPDFYFFYDCLWNDVSSQHKAFIFQYQITTQSGDTYLYKYFFKIPQANKMDEELPTNIKDWEVFSVADMSSMPSRLSLMVQAVPPKFNVTTYIIKVIKNNITEEEHIEHHDPLEPMFTYTYQTNSKPGSYYFNVTFEHPECDQNCSISRTPLIIIHKVPGRSTLEIVVGAVVLLAVGTTSYLLWARTRKVTSPDLDNPPKFLMIYEPVSLEYLNSMVKVAKYFKETYNIHVLIDVLRIPDSENKNPIKWYKEAFKTADFVGIFLSPKTASEEKATVKKYIIYPESYSIALHQLEQTLAFKSKCKFFAVALPNSNASLDSLPEEAKPLKKRHLYKLPKDLKSLLKLFGVIPKNDAAKDFTNALENTSTEHDTLVLTLDDYKEDIIDGIITPGSSIHSSPISTHNNCCKAFTISDPELDNSGRFTPDSSDDQLSDC